MTQHLPGRIRTWLDVSHAVEVAALRDELAEARSHRKRALESARHHERQERALQGQLDTVRRAQAAAVAEVNLERSLRVAAQRRADEAEEFVLTLQRRPGPDVEARREIERLRRAYAASQNLLAKAEGRPLHRPPLAVTA